MTSVRQPALSPSRANDFRQCSLLFRFRVVDRLPEPPSLAPTLGTLVHAVLEDLFELPAARRTFAAAQEALAPRWDRMVQERPELAALVPDAPARERFLGDGVQRVETYFRLENPMRLEPAAREQRMEVTLADGPALRGIVDRIDEAPDGRLRVVDYKTGAAPRPGYGEAARFQMRFYALLVERLRGVRPSVLRLLYLKDGTTTDYTPTAEDVEAVEGEIRALWSQIEDAARHARFTPSPSRLCDWCAFQDRCPQFGGTPGPVDPDAVERALGVRPVAS